MRLEHIFYKRNKIKIESMNCLLWDLMILFHCRWIGWIQILNKLFYLYLHMESMIGDSTLNDHIAMGQKSLT